MELNQSGKSIFLLLLSLEILPMEVSVGRLAVCSVQKKESEMFCCGSSGTVTAVSPDPTLACLLGRYRIFCSDDTKLIHSDIRNSPSRVRICV
jgi:hypothetical protein